MTSRMRPNRSFGERGLPSMNTVPPSSFSSPQHRRDRVVFPAPFSPMIPITSPNWAEKLSGPMVRGSRNVDPALLVECCEPYENVRLFISKAAFSHFDKVGLWSGIAFSADFSCKFLRPIWASVESPRDNALAASYTWDTIPSSMTTIRSMRSDR